MGFLRPLIVHTVLFAVSVFMALFWNLMDIIGRKKTGPEARHNFYGFIWGYLMCLALLLLMSI